MSESSKSSKMLPAVFFYDIEKWFKSARRAGCIVMHEVGHKKYTAYKNAVFAGDWNDDIRSGHLLNRVIHN